VDLNNHIPLVYRIVQQVGSVMPPREYHNDHDDMVQDGLLGLLHACRRYRADRGCTFATYAWPCIHGYITVGIRRRRRHQHASLTPPTIWREVRHDMDLKSVDDKDECRAILADLTPRLRGIARMHWLRGMRHKEVARKIGMTRQRAHQLCRRAMDAMRENVAQA
jgi:RNA polymerase sigma factor (sigma-70 family)